MALHIVEEAIYELLKDLAGGAVSAQKAKKGQQAPFIIYQRINSERWQSIDGPSGVAMAEIQIDAYDKLYYDAKRLGAEVELLLDGFEGPVEYGNDSPQRTVEIASIVCQNDIDILDDTDQTTLSRSSAVYRVTYYQR